MRRLWLLHCASEDEVEKFKTGGIDKHFGDLTAEIESAICAHQPTLSTIKKNAWGNYTEEDVIRCINAAAALGLLGSAQLSVMAKQDALVKEHLGKMEIFAKSS